MKALSLTQPWATLVAIGAKKIETRSWSTRYRGPLAIHASKVFPLDVRVLCGMPPFKEALAAGRYRLPDLLPLGAAIAVVNLDWCRIITGDNAPPEPERSFGDYTPGRYAWHLANVQRFPEPIPARGALGLWEWPTELLEVVNR